MRTLAKTKAKMSIVGLWVAIWWCLKWLLATRLQNFKTLLSAARTSNSRCLVLYLVQRCDARVILF
jgi:hypothetical protein